MRRSARMVCFFWVSGFLVAAIGCNDVGTQSDSAGSEVATDGTVDTSGDVSRDAVGDLAGETSSDVPTDAPPDAPADAPVDTPADVAADSPADAADVAADVPADVGQQGTIKIYVAGDQTPKTFNDGLSGQTPSDYVIAISAYQALTSADDPSPQLCFDHGSSFVEADMSTDTLVGECITSQVQTATYTHGRTRVEWARYTVDATFHYLGLAYPGSITLFRAYSQTTYEGLPYAPNTGWILYSGIVDVTIPWVYVPFQPAGGVEMDVVGGEAWMKFPYTNPLFIDSSNTDSHWARFHWEVGDSFRWDDISLLNYADGTWDVQQPVTLSEEVLMYGVSGYHVTASTD